MKYQHLVSGKIFAFIIFAISGAIFAWITLKYKELDNIITVAFILSTIGLVTAGYLCGIEDANTKHKTNPVLEDNELREDIERFKKTGQLTDDTVRLIKLTDYLRKNLRM